MATKTFLTFLFPQAIDASGGRSGREINGLPKGTVPQNCDILLSGLHSSPITGRQEHYLVRTENVLVFLRVCSAHESSGYEEYAVLRETAETPEEQDALLEYAEKSILSICGHVRKHTES